MNASPYPFFLTTHALAAFVGAVAGFLMASAAREEDDAAHSEPQPERDIRPAPIKIFMPIHGLTLRPGELRHLAAVVRHEAETARYMHDLMVAGAAPVDRANVRRAEDLERAAAVLGLVAATREADAPGAPTRITADQGASYDC